MRARLADPEQRVAVRAEQRAGIEDLYPDVAEVLSLDAATHKAGSADHSSSGMMVIGRKAYSIEMTANASRK